MTFKAIEKKHFGASSISTEKEFPTEKSLVKYINCFSPEEAESGDSISIYVKPRTSSPVWHYALTYNLSTPDMVNYCKANIVGALSHYYHLYAQFDENEDK